ncbi:MAG: hypothetical protein AAFY76_02480, partial [Cyanobacteria bacterium J06649_11]
MEALQDKFNIDWEKDRVKSRYNSPPPSYKKTGEKSIFLGTKLNHADPSIYDFMQRSSEVEVKEFTAKYLGNRIREYNKLTSPEDTITLTKQYTRIYFNYLGYDSFYDFLNSNHFSSSETIQYKKIQEDLEFSSKRRKQFTFVKFYFLGLRLSEKRIVRHQMLIDFKRETVRLVSEDGETYNDGSFAYKKGFIQIIFDRTDVIEQTWMPFSVYFQWSNTLDKFRGGVGTYSGVAYNKKRAIAGYSILVKQEDYDKQGSSLPLSAERFLFLENHGIDVIADHSLEEALKVSDNDYGQLKKFIGTHEIIDFGRSKTTALSSYKLSIDENFLSVIHSPDKEYEYIVRLRAEGETLIMNVFSKHSTKHPREVIFSNCCVISKNRPLYDNGTTVIYRGGVSGISRSKTAEHFPVVLVLNPPSPTSRRYSLSEVKKVFLKDPKRKMINQLIIEHLSNVEAMRLKDVSEILGSLRRLFLLPTV